MDQKKLDGVLQPATPEGFEMLVDNFSLGILGTILAVVSKNVIGPILGVDALGNAAGALVDAGLVPLADIPIEVAKVFLNNAINHGVLGPLGAAEAAETGQSSGSCETNRSRTWITSCILVRRNRNVEAISTRIYNYSLLWWYS